MNSQIILCKNINVDKNYVNVLNYTEEQMLNLCRQNAIVSANNYSFLRPTGNIFVNFTYEQCLQANYIAFQNKDYSNKWFFAWIDDVIYKSDNNCELSFTIDAWSTWFNKLIIKKCFIARHHVNNDTIGLHTVPENLDIGDVIEEQETEDSSYLSTYGFYIAIATNWKINDNTTGTESTESAKGTQFAGISVYDKVISGNTIALFKITNINDLINVGLFVLRTNADGHVADIENMYILPTLSINESTLTSHSASVGGQSFSWDTMPFDITPTKFNTTINKRTSFTNFIPKNNKCFVYPYNYLFVTNNQGSNNIYKYEDFNSANCVFENQFSISVGGSCRLVPKNYKNMSTNDDESLPLGKYPTCSWSSDAYTNWLTQNAINIPTTIISMITGTSANLSNKKSSALGIATNISSGIASLIGDFYQAKLMPNITGGQSVGDIAWACDRNVFTFREMRAKTEYLEIIDDYFTRFGYAINKLEIPNITGRKYWNYVEIGQSEEIGYGDVPNKYLEIINNACRKGVTIWHDNANIGNYNLENIIL